MLKSLTHCLNISTHATHKGGDSKANIPVVSGIVFQLTPPIRAATHKYFLFGVVSTISTHATHKGGDLTFNSGKLVVDYISTHATHKGGDFKVYK